MGIKEQLIFPEINYDKVDTIKGMNIVFTTTAKTDEEAAARSQDFSDCRLRNKGGRRWQNISQSKTAEKTEVFDTCIYQMQDLRKTALRTEKVRHLPYLLP